MKMKINEKTPEQVKYWTDKQTYIALGNALIACANMKIDATPMEGFDAAKYDEILGLKEKGLFASVVLAVGYRTHWPLDKNQSLRGVVQIAHGIGEHIGRYEEVALALNKEGFVVYGNDHRGHGRTANDGKTLGQYTGKNFWEDAVEDMHEMTELIKSTHPDTFFILLGHSLGSLLGRDYISRYGAEVDAVIISGTAGYIKILGPAGVVITNLLVRFRGSTATSPLIESFFFDQFNRKFKPNRTKLDWVSRDEYQVDKFEKDPLRSEKFHIAILQGAALGGKMANASETLKKTPKDLPMYILSNQSSRSNAGYDQLDK